MPIPGLPGSDELVHMCEQARKLCGLIGLANSSSNPRSWFTPGGAEYDPDEDPYFWEL